MIASANSDRDLEISTSLDVQALDTRVDSFAAKQVSSQQITAGHLEKIQEKVQAVRILHHTTHETTLEISKSTEKIHQTLHDIRTSQAESQQSTRLQAEKLDGALAAIQRSLLSMASNGRPRPRLYELLESLIKAFEAGELNAAKNIRCQTSSQILCSIRWMSRQV